MMPRPSSPSDRTLGLIVGGALFVAAMVRWVRSGSIHWAPLTLAAALWLLAWTAPSALMPVNRAGRRLIAGLTAVSNNLLLGAAFYGILTPVAVLMRLIGRDAMSRARSGESSYFTPVGRQTNAETLRDQF